MRRGERSIASIPWPILFLLGLTLLFQFNTIYNRTVVNDQLKYQDLPVPMDIGSYQAMSFGSQKLMGYLLSIKLQLHDTQAGQHLPYSKISYDNLVNWLELLERLDKDSEYPQMLASRIYSNTPNEDQLRRLLQFVEASFLRDPQLHWRRLTEAVILARHRIDDLPLASRLASLLSSQPKNISMPAWARDMHFLILAELNEFEASIAIITALLESGEVLDNDEVRFLKQKLSLFQQKLSETQQVE